MNSRVICSFFFFCVIFVQVSSRPSTLVGYICHLKEAILLNEFDQVKSIITEQYKTSPLKEVMLDLFQKMKFPALTEIAEMYCKIIQLEDQIKILHEDHPVANCTTAEPHGKGKNVLG